jgi:hypothetical protein
MEYGQRKSNSSLRAIRRLLTARVQTKHKCYAAALNKKRIEVFVSPELSHEVVAAIRELEQEATLYDSKGLSKERQKVRGGRGMVESDSA